MLWGAVGAAWKRYQNPLEASKAAEADLAAPGRPQGRRMVRFHKVARPQGRSDVLRGAPGALWQRWKSFLEALKAAEASLAVRGRPQGRRMLYFHRFWSPNAVFS